MILVISVYLFLISLKAKPFMGDCGSITLGYLVGYFTFVLIFNGDWKIALAIIFYPWCYTNYFWKMITILGRDYLIIFLRALKDKVLTTKIIGNTIYNTLNLLIYFMIIYNMDWIMFLHFY